MDLHFRRELPIHSPVMSLIQSPGCLQNQLAIVQTDQRRPQPGGVGPQGVQASEGLTACQAGFQAGFPADPAAGCHLSGTLAVAFVPAGQPEYLAILSRFLSNSKLESDNHYLTNM